MSRCCLSSKQVSPAPWDSINNQLIEIRPKRFLHIKHINPRPRDEQFAKELQTFLQYRKKGVASDGPMIVPKKPMKVSLDQNPNHSNSSSNTQPGVPFINKQMLDLKPRDQTPDSVYSTSEDRKTLISSSGIDVSVNSPIELPQPNKLATSDVNNQSSSLRKDNNSVLFFIHGVGGSSDIWKSQIDFFTKLGYEIVAPDLIGHGLSFAPKDLKSYHFDQIAADLEEIFDKYCKRNNVVIGHSYGCSFAAFLARNRTRRVTKLIMISGGGPIPLAPQANVFSLPISMLTCLRPCVQCKYERSAFSQSKKIEKSYEAFSIPVPTYVLSNIMKGQIWSDGDEFYHNWIVSPTLLIYGQQDKLITLREEERMREAIYNCELEVLSEAGHMVMLEEPESVNKLLHNFLLHEFRLEGNLNEIKNEIQERCKSRSSIRSAKSVKSIPDL